MFTGGKMGWISRLNPATGVIVTDHGHIPSGVGYKKKKQDSAAPGKCLLPTPLVIDPPVM